MKRIWNAIGKTAKDGSFQKKAIKHVEQMESGAVAVSFLSLLFAYCF